MPYFSCERLEPLDRVGREVRRSCFTSFIPSSIFFSCLVGLEAVVGGDALDPDLGQADDVVVPVTAAQLLDEGLQPFADLGQDALPGLGLLDPAVDALLDEDALERVPVPLLLELARADLQLLLQERPVRLTLRLRISRTPRNTGLSSSITQAAGESVTWQSVKT